MGVVKGVAHIAFLQHSPPSYSLRTAPLILIDKPNLSRKFLNYKKKLWQIKDKLPLLNLEYIRYTASCASDMLPCCYIIWSKIKSIVSLCWYNQKCSTTTNSQLSSIVSKYLRCLPKVLEHLLWFILQTSYNIPSPLKQCCVQEIWINLQVKVMPFCKTKGFHYRLNIVRLGDGVYTPIGDRKKGKE